MPTIGPMQLVIIAVVILILFGGSKLAGLGKSTGRALREFKEETKGLRESGEEDAEKAAKATEEVPGVTATTSEAEYNPYPTETVDAEIVDANRRTDS